MSDEEAVEHDAPHPSTIDPDPDEEWPDDNGNNRIQVACAVLHTDAEGNTVPCPGYPHAGSGTA